MSKIWEESLKPSSAEAAASFLKKDSASESKRSASSSRHAKRVKGPMIEGVTLKAAPVEVATPRFSKNSVKIPTLEGASILTNKDGHFREDGKTVVEYKVDLDENIFSAVRTRGDTNSLIAMCDLAFAEHRPMALTPDLLWHYIVKGISIHIHKYSEDLRRKIVSHEGKKELTVIRDIDIHDLDADVWSSVFKEFRSQIEATLTEDGKAIISKNKFSTTSEVIDDVSCIALMGAMSKYFAYRFKILCGIPSVTLLGKREDWVELKNRSERALQLLSSGDLKGEVSLSWWKSPLLAVLDKLIQCYDDPESAENMDWMARIYNYNIVGCGETSISGWVNVFFPYLGECAEDSPVNRFVTLDLVSSQRVEGNDFSQWQYEYNFNDFPKGISSVNFILDYLGIKQYKMKMYGGPCCVSEQMAEAGFPCPPGTLHAHFGWLIKHDADIRQG